MPAMNVFRKSPLFCLTGSGLFMPGSFGLVHRIGLVPRTFGNCGERLFTTGSLDIRPRSSDRASRCLLRATSGQLPRTRSALCTRQRSGIQWRIFSTGLQAHALRSRIVVQRPSSQARGPLQLPSNEPDPEIVQKELFELEARRLLGQARFAILNVLLIFVVLFVVLKAPQPSIDANRPVNPADNRSLDMTKYLTYRVGDWPPKDLESCIPYVGSIFTHGSLLHLLANSFAFFAVCQYNMPRMGIPITLATFVTGGFLASQLDCFVSQAYARNQYPWLFRYIKSGPDPDPSRTLSANHLGASSGLASLLVVIAISAPLSSWRFLIVPVPIPAFVLAGGIVGWDAWSWYSNVADGIGHGGHLAGHLVGLALWLVVLRWTKDGKMARELRKWDRWR